MNTGSSLADLSQLAKPVARPEEGTPDPDGSLVYDVIVAGVGGMGSAAAFHLASRGYRVLALERHTIPHELGSSHGLTRIIRLAYFEDPSYVPLLRRAFQLWRELERQGDVGQLLHVTGAIDAGPPGSRVFEGSRASCEIHDLPHEVLSAAELSRRHPAYRLPSNYSAVLQPDGGFLLPERCIEAHSRLAIAAGADVRANTAIHRWEPASSGGVTVDTDAGPFHADQLVVCAGAWTQKLLPELRTHLTPERQVLGWFEVSDRAAFAPERFPVFVMQGEEGTFYGFPEFDAPGFKIGKYHHRGQHADPDTLDREVSAEDIRVLREGVARYFPAANGPALSTRVCMFTNTVDEHFILDRLPGSPQVLVVSPCSGHGFKFCSVIGEIVADLVEHDETPHDIALHRFARLQPPAGPIPA